MPCRLWVFGVTLPVRLARGDAGVFCETKPMLGPSGGRMTIAGKGRKNELRVGEAVTHGAFRKKTVGHR